MKEFFLLFSIACLLSACGGNTSEIASESSMPQPISQEMNTAVPPTAAESTCTYNYTIVGREESSMPLADGQSIKKLRVTVEIPIEYSDLGLNDIADDIKRKESSFEYLFVEFYLLNMPKTGPNYGLAKRTPHEKDVAINYVAPPKEPEQKPDQPKVKKPYDGCTV